MTARGLPRPPDQETNPASKTRQLAHKFRLPGIECGSAYWSWQGLALACSGALLPAYHEAVARVEASEMVWQVPVRGNRKNRKNLAQRCKTKTGHLALSLFV